MISALSNKISRNVAVFKYSSIISMYILVSIKYYRSLNSVYCVFNQFQYKYS